MTGIVLTDLTEETSPVAGDFLYVHQVGAFRGEKVTIQNAVEALFTSAEITQLQNIDTTTLSTSQWAYLGAMDQALATTDSVDFVDLNATGNIVAGSADAAPGGAFAAQFMAKSTQPGYYWFESDQGSTAAEWDISAINGDMYVRARGAGNTLGDTVMKVNRSGSSVSSIEMGGDTLPDTTEVFDLGSASLEWDNVYTQNAVTVSDERRKNDMGDIAWATDFLRQLDPKVFSYKDTVIPESVDVEGNTVPEKTITHSRPHTGLMAQQVKASMDAIGVADWAGYAYDDDSDTHLLRLPELFGVLVKGWQDIDARLTVIENGG